MEVRVVELKALEFSSEQRLNRRQPEGQGQIAVMSESFGSRKIGRMPANASVMSPRRAEGASGEGRGDRRVGAEEDGGGVKQLTLSFPTSVIYWRPPPL